MVSTLSLIEGYYAANAGEMNLMLTIGSLYRLSCRLNSWLWPSRDNETLIMV